MGLHTLIPELEILARHAGRMAQEARGDLAMELKEGGSIVTKADFMVEEYLRKELPKLVTGASIWGEEFGCEEEGTGGLWLIDPVDGTSNFAFGSPLWGVSVGLLRAGRIELGCVFLPDLYEMYLSAHGHGVTCNGISLAKIPPGRIEPWHLVSYCESAQRAAKGTPLPGKMRCTGSFVVEGAFVMRQRFRALVGIREKLYDVAPCVLMANELGAEVRYADGRPFLLDELKNDVHIVDPWLIFPADSGFLLPGR